MSLILFLAVSGAILAVAYRLMGRYLVRLVGLDDRTQTPAHAHRDGHDYEPARWSWLLPQHFSAIAAAGPVVGPILAGIMFGWLPAWLWIIVGSIFIGGVHDFMTLVASVRHGGKSIAEVVRRQMNRRSHLLFLLFVWVSLVYVIIAFADVTAGAFTQAASTAEAAAPGPAVATSSILYLGLALLMGWMMRSFKWSEHRAQLVFLPLVFGAILVGPMIPFDLGALLPDRPAQQTWNYVLFAYCFLAALAPLWLLMQPRGALGGYFLYVVIVAGVLGIVVGGLTGKLDLVSPAFGPADLFLPSGTLPPLFPVLFITIACGACSGFHSIVASGTTSKQLDRERDARPVAYGGMLLEAFFACISLAAVMILAKPSGRPDAVFADGVALFIHHASFGLLSVDLARGFALLCFATFVFDTLDACTRLARYVLMELLGWSGRAKAALATGITLAGPAMLASLPPAVINGQTVPIWRVFWNLFGTSNQLLAALTLLGLTMWLHRRGNGAWLTLGPAIVMLTMTLWSLGLMLNAHLDRIKAGPVAAMHHVEAGVSSLLVVLAVWLIIESLLLIRTLRPPSALQPAPA